MKVPFLLLMLSVITFWGLFGFFSKIAAVRIGLQSLFWGSVLAAPFVTLFYLLLSKQLVSLNFDKIGILFSILAGIMAISGAVFFTILLKNQQASLVVPFTGLYPMVTVILALLFLHERLSLTQFLGILFAVVAIFLVTRA